MDTFFQFSSFKFQKKLAFFLKVKEGDLTKNIGGLVKLSFWEIFWGLKFGVKRATC